MENTEFPKQQPPEHISESSSKRLRLAFEALLKTQVKNIEVTGREHIQEIPREKKVIIAVSHYTDLDIPIAVSALADSLDLAVVNMSVHHSLRGEAGTFLGLKLVGQENFIPIDYNKQSDGTKRSGRFNVDNFIPMQEALEHGKRVLMAAHNPLASIDEIPEAGYGAAYLALVEDALILPVGISLWNDGQKSDVGKYGGEMKTFLSRPEARVRIGEPFALKKIEGMDTLTRVLQERKSGNTAMSKEDLALFVQAKKALEEQANAVLKTVTDLAGYDDIPEEAD